MPYAYTSLALLARPCSSSSGDMCVSVPLCTPEMCVSWSSSRQASPRSATLATSTSPQPGPSGVAAPAAAAAALAGPTSSFSSTLPACSTGRPASSSTSQLQLQLASWNVGGAASSSSRQLRLARCQPGSRNFIDRQAKKGAVLQSPDSQGLNPGLPQSGLQQSGLQPQPPLGGPINIAAPSIEHSPLGLAEL
eukprot:GHRQ01012510.1.p1 GENE.GHRQ01012510.1~~GHRQ01012510.1.p1  ORF type:complete len:193 (-),score=51.35 GHRQ01012510.1:366-944(-)